MLTSIRTTYITRANLIQLALIALVTLPVVIYVFKFSILYRNGIFGGEDWDYFAQSYEAARASILHYHQFPWWNAWSVGGAPLFANPQFGLFSIQTALVLLFGTVAGLHYAMMAYFVLGFWGMYLLLRRLGSKSRIISILLSYIWVFSSFNAWHLGGGHLSFAVYLLAPWAFLTLLNIHKRRGWIWFMLTTSLLIHTAPHYLTVETLAICGAIVAVQLYRYWRSHRGLAVRRYLPILKPYLLASIAILVLCGSKLLYTFQFTHEYPRLTPLDAPVPPKLFIAALLFRHAVDPSALTAPYSQPYGWAEYANYFGIVTLFLFVYLAIRKLESIKNMSTRDWLILAATLIAAALSLGAFWRFSPFNILHYMPIFNQMRVPSRFLCWFAFGVILFLGKLPRKPIVYVLLVISAIDVFAANYGILNYPQRPYIQAQKPDNTFQQYEFYKTDPALGQIGILSIQDFRLLRATQMNQGEIYGYEPLLNIGEYYYLPGTTRCGVNKGCPFVITKNATVTRWSPHQIDLKRTGEGPIKVNMNPGKVWRVNGKKPFANDKILELRKDFVIDDPAQDIHIRYNPSL
ncbi:MAG: hypothetical protein JWO35_158 [Candidatus Saccharibacteria bacterium]|nr:hypothetical protein [Candidatus Saccharibacteria bacterium]